MKPRPRSVEREVSECLSEIYLRHNYPPVKRIPVLGRTGPDIEINQTRFVIDVKSRIAVPQSHLLAPGEIGLFEDYVGVRLGELDHQTFKSRLLRPSLLVTAWLAHMQAWTQEYYPNGISALILHRPHVWIANTTFIVRTEKWSDVCKTFQTQPLNPST